MFLLYITDNHHTVESKILLSVCSDKEKTLNLAYEYCVHNKVLFSSDDVLNIEYNNQTQGLKSDFEFFVEEIQVNNKLL